MHDEIAQARFRPRRAGPRLFRRSDEIAKVEATDSQVSSHRHTSYATAGKTDRSARPRGSGALSDAALVMSSELHA